MQSAPVCSVEVTLLDLITWENITVRSTDLNTTGNTTTLTTSQLAKNHHYNVSMWASNIAGSATSHATISKQLIPTIQTGFLNFYYLLIGTHDVQGVITTELPNNAIAISINFSADSRAKGALIHCAFITVSGNVDISQSIFLALDRNISYNYTFPFNLSPGGYRVFVYDIEQNGKLSIPVNYPAVTNEFTTNGNGLRTCT